MKKIAYTILEVVIYLSLVLIISAVLGRIALQVDRYVTFSGELVDSLQDTHLCFDRMRRDMMGACCEWRYWDADKLVFRKSCIGRAGRVITKDVGFCLKNNKLFRVEGLYDFYNRVWIRKVLSLMGCGFGSMGWKVAQRGGVVTGVLVVCGEDRWHVRVRNGQV